MNFDRLTNPSVRLARFDGFSRFFSGAEFCRNVLTRNILRQNLKLRYFEKATKIDKKKVPGEEFAEFAQEFAFSKLRCSEKATQIGKKIPRELIIFEAFL